MNIIFLKLQVFQTKYTSFEIGFVEDWFVSNSNILIVPYNIAREVDINEVISKFYPPLHEASLNKTH